jgi:dCTP deaminase
MFLSDTDIEKAVKAKKIRIDNFDIARLNPASYDILLGNKFIVNKEYKSKIIDPVNKIYPETEEIEIPDTGEFILHPGHSVLGLSHDFFGSDEFLIQLGGKSSLARVGLMIHNTAGVINPGHYLNIVLELTNQNTLPIILRPKMPIGQLVFSKLSSKPKRDYKKVGNFAKNNWENFIKAKKVVASGKKK